MHCDPFCQTSQNATEVLRPFQQGSRFVAVKFRSGDIGLTLGQELGLNKPTDKIVKAFQNIRLLAFYNHLRIDKVQARVIPHE